MRAIAMSLGENVIVTNDSSNGSNGSNGSGKSSQPTPAPDPDAEEEDLPEEEYEPLGMISHKKSLITVFGHKHKIKKFINKI